MARETKEKEDPSFNASFCVWLFFFFATQVPPKKKKKKIWYKRKMQTRGICHIRLKGVAVGAFGPLFFFIKDKSIPKFFCFPFLLKPASSISSLKKKNFGWVPTSEESVADTLLPSFLFFLGWRDKTSGRRVRLALPYILYRRTSRLCPFLFLFSRQWL